MDITYLTWIVYLLTSAIYIGIIYNFFNTCFECYFAKKKEVLIFIGIYLIDSLFFIIDNPAMNVIWSIGLLFVLAFMYLGDFKARLSSALFVYMTGFLADFLIACSVVYSQGISFSDVKRGSSEYIFGMVASKILTVVFARGLAHLMKPRKMAKIPVYHWITIIFTPIGSIIIVYNLFQSHLKDSVPPIQTIIVAIIVIMINFLVIVVYEKVLNDCEVSLNNQLLQQQLTFYAYQNYLAESSEKFVRKTKHDIKSMMLAFKVETQNQDIDKIENRIDQLLGKINDLEGPANSGNLSIDSIINFKAISAEKQDIVFRVDLNIPENLDLDSTSICVILGNILDNAIEATGDVFPVSKRVIEIIATYLHSCLFLQITNPHIGSIQKSNHGEFLSRKRYWKTPGIGIQSIAAELQLMNGDMDINYSESVFAVKIVFYEVKISKILEETF